MPPDDDLPTGGSATGQLEYSTVGETAVYITMVIVRGLLEWYA
jgi:hypothetical protein